MIQKLYSKDWMTSNNEPHRGYENPNHELLQPPIELRSHIIYLHDI